MSEERARYHAAVETLLATVKECKRLHEEFSAAWARVQVASQALHNAAEVYERSGEDGREPEDEAARNRLRRILKEYQQLHASLLPPG